MSDQGNGATTASWPGAGRQVQKLEYDGTIGALYWIFIKNFLLNIVTLTIYRFWGKTNLRRYAWSHTSLQGQRFEYTGRGGELFVGFLIVVGLYIVFFLTITILSLFLGEHFAQLGPLLFFPAVVYIIFVAQYSAQNYRLTRTLWSGIRGGMTGSAWKYGIKGFLFTILNVVTLNLAGPWTTLRLVEDRFNHSYFGNTKASLQASAKSVYGWYLLGFLFTIVGLGVLYGIYWLVINNTGIAVGMEPIFQKMQDAAQAGQEADLTPDERNAYFLYIVVTAFIAYLGVAIVSIIAFAPYMAAMFRTIASNLQLAELRFASDVTAGRYISLWIGNVLLVVLTLGLGFPIAIHRSLRFFADRVIILGELDVARLQQTTLEHPKFGEGLLEAFDPGFM